MKLTIRRYVFGWPPLTVPGVNNFTRFQTIRINQGNLFHRICHFSWEKLTQKNPRFLFKNSAFPESVAKGPEDSKQINECFQNKSSFWRQKVSFDSNNKNNSYAILQYITIQYITPFPVIYAIFYILYILLIQINLPLTFAEWARLAQASSWSQGFDN